METLEPVRNASVSPAPRTGASARSPEPAPEVELRLGSLAISLGMITAGQLQSALSIQATENASGKLARQLGLILLSRGFLDEVQLVQLVQKQQDVRRRRP